MMPSITHAPLQAGLQVAPTPHEAVRHWTSNARDNGRKSPAAPCGHRSRIQRPRDDEHRQVQSWAEKFSGSEELIIMVTIPSTIYFLQVRQEDRHQPGIDILLGRLAHKKLIDK